MDKKIEEWVKETLCISCGTQSRTVDDTGRCEDCRRELYEITGSIDNCPSLTYLDIINN